MAIKVTAQDYLTKSETKFRKFKREWESFTREVPDKVFNIFKNGIRPSVSSRSPGYGQINIYLTFENDTDSVKYILKNILKKFRKKATRNLMR